MKSRWIEHKGKRIFYADYTDFGHDASAFQKEVEDVVGIMRSQPENSMRVIVNVSGTVISQQVMPLLKSSAKEGKPYSCRTAVVGITGFKKVLLDAISLFSGESFESINDLEQAKDWVVAAD